MFKETKKGMYDKQEVDSYLLASKIQNDSQLADQKDRIFELVEQLKTQGKQLHDTQELLNEYQKRENQISKAILNAINKSEEIEAVYEEKLDKLNFFIKKFLVYFRKMMEQYPLEGEMIDINEFARQLENFLKDSPSNKVKTEKIESISDIYDSETQRLKFKAVKTMPISETLESETVKQKHAALLEKYTKGADEAVASVIKKITPKNIKNHLEKSERQPAEAALDIEEALSPKESLEELCKQLGLLK